jgi:hypothetical protein
VNLEPADAVNQAQDEGEDVEGHVNLGANLGAPADAVNLAHDDEDDDVEGHVNLA